MNRDHTLDFSILIACYRSGGPSLDQSWFDEGCIYGVLHRLQYSRLLELCPGLLARAGGGDIPLHV